MERILNKQNKVMLSEKTKQIMVDIICYLFVLLWLYAAVNKLLDFQKFQVQLGQSPFLTGFATPIAWIIPTIEIVFALGLIFYQTRLIALYASFSLMFMFTIYILGILNFADRIPCACGGILNALNWKEHLIFNIFFVVIGLIAILFETKLDKSRVKT